MTPTSPPAPPPHLAREYELCRQAATVQAELAAQDAAWGRGGWTRRSFLAGLGLVGVAALGTQLVTTRAAFSASGTGSATDNTLITIFLRGAADGLHVLVPNTTDLGLGYLQQVRPQLIPAASKLISLPGTNGWALNSALAPLYNQLWASGELAFVPAVSSGGISRSHFQAQQYVEHGGSDTATTGWLDRVLTQLGPGTTFRAVSEGYTAPTSVAGAEPVLVVDSLADFVFPTWDSLRSQAEAAVGTLYRGQTGNLGEDVPTTLAALDTAATIRAQGGPQNGASYPTGNFSQTLQDLAAILRAEVGLQVATIDLGGWDTHTSEVSQLDGLLASAAASLSAFMTDLGPTRRQRVTVALVTEFGRRVEMNASYGTDHGHGSVMWLLGGGIASGGVLGHWNQLSDATLDQGDVPGLNDVFDLFGELVQKRLGVGSLSTVFPGYSITPIGIATTT